MSSPLTDYSSLFYLSPFPNWVYDLATYAILDVNQAAIDHYGYTREEFLRLTIKDLRPKEEIPVLLAAHANISHQDDNIYFGVFTHQKKSGALIRMKIHGHKVDFQEKKCMVVVCQDVTEEEQKIQELKESEERLKAASSIAKLGYWRLNLDANTLIWSDEIFNIWGRDRFSFHVDYRNFFETIHPDDRKIFELEQKASFAGEKDHDIVHRIVLPDGSIKWVHELGRLIKDHNSIPSYFEGTVQDVTQQKEEEQRLRLLESVITNTTDAVLITEAEPQDAPGPRIIYVNEAFTKMTGYTSEEVIGKSPRILQGPKSDKAQLAKLGQALRKWESHEITTLNYKKNGEEFWINFTVSPVANENGWFTHWIAIERDVTDKKNQELEQNLLAEISKIFNEELKLSDATQKLCSTFAEIDRFDFVEVWTPSLDDSRLQLLSFSHHSAEGSEFYNQSGHFKQLNFGEGLLGLVWKTKEPILLDLEENGVNFLRIKAATQSGIKSILGVPLLFQEKIVGVLVFGSSKETTSLNRHLPIFRKLETFIGSEINRKSLETNLIHLFEAIPDIICLIDFKGKFLKMNKAGCELLGHGEDGLLNSPFDELVHPEDKNISESVLNDLGTGESTTVFEIRFLNKKGEIIWLSWTFNSVKEEKVIYASAKNITVEKKLRELNTQASSLARIGSWEVDLVKGKLFWSEMVHELHETNPETFIPDIATGINFYRQDFREMVDTSVSRCIAEGVSFNFEAVLITAKNNERWVRAIGSSEFLDGKCIRVYGSFQDIHEKKESENRLVSLADNLPGVVVQYVINPDGTDSMKYVSKGSKEIFGFEPEEIKNDINLFWGQIRATGEFERIQKQIEDSIKSKTKSKFQWKFLMPDGTMRLHAGYGTPEFMTDGTVVFNALVLDITEEKKKEDLLNQVSRMAIVGSWELDLMNKNGDSMYWSPIIREILEVDDNYNASIFKGLEFLTEDRQIQVQNSMEKLIKTGEEFDLEFLLKTAKGNDRWIRCIGKSERINGKCVKVFGSFQDIHQSKSLEIHISEILGSISDAFYAVDKDWNFTYFNKEAENLLLKKRTEILGKNIWHEFPAAVGTELEEIYRRVAKSEKPESFEYLFPGDGNWYELNTYPFHGGLSAYFKNINERKQTAFQLEKAYQEKANILESIGDGFFSVDKDWIVTYWNKKAEEIIGLNREDLVGFNLWEKFPQAKELDFFRQYKRAFDTQTPVHFEEYFPPYNQWYEANGYPTPEGISVFFRDITEKKLAEEQILQANERFEKVTEATNDAIWDWDIKNKSYFRSKGIEKFFGAAASQTLDEDDFWKDKFHPEDLPLIKQSVESALDNSDTTRWEMEYRIFKEDGEIGYVVDKGVIIRNKKGKAVRMVGAMTDISDRKHHEKELLKLNESLKKYAHDLELTNEQLEQFAFIASHDLQEPLRMISSFLDQLQRKYGEQLDDKAHQYIHFATNGAKRMKQIILDLLEYSRAGKFNETLSKVNLDLLMSDYRSLRKKIIDEKSAIIDYSTLPVIEGYRAPLTQTLHCLLDNAIKYSRDGVPPRIELNVEETLSEWIFSVRDNGLGIEPMFFDKIFIIFQRLHNREQYEGSGIGLSIVKKQVESWGGKIWLESNLGEGSNFFFTIPKSQKNQLEVKEN